MSERTGWSVSILLVVGFVAACFLAGAFGALGILTAFSMVGIKP